jgi:3-hydroxy acid dehydrogenase/malonic semialdehyde reductase
MLAAVTGATSGFGLAICRRFVADGGRVIAMGRRLDRLVALQSELGAKKCHIIQIDVRNRTATESWVSSLPDEFSAVDVLVNNAGLALGLEPANDANLDDWEVCVLGGVCLPRHAV